MNRKNNLPFWLFSLSVFCILILYPLLQDGMFVDGVTYAAISKNLSEGIGSFWSLHFSNSLFTSFHEHPPGVFGIQSIFFFLLGKSIYVERFYCLLTFFICALLILMHWRLLFDKTDERKYLSWLPFLLWCITPVIFWSYSNNMLENTMSIFTLSASLLILKSDGKNTLLNLAIAGMCIFAASLCKGFPGLFPLAIPLVKWFIYRNTSFIKSIFHSLFLTIIVAVIYRLLLLNESARVSLVNYIYAQVIPGLQGTQDAVDTRFFILMRLGSQLLVPGILALLFLIYGKWKGLRLIPGQNDLKQSALLLLIGLSGSLPIMISLKQSGYYLVPALPYFALAIALIISPAVLAFSKGIILPPLKNRIAVIATACLFTTTLMLSIFQIGKNGRDEIMLRDVHLIGNNIPKGTTLGSTKELWKDWSLQGYLVRHYYICQSDRISFENDYLLLESESQIPAGMKAQKVNIPTIKYNLYKIIK